MKYGLFLVSLSMFFSSTVRAEMIEGSRCKSHYTAKNTDFDEWSSGVWTGTITGKYYQTPTKIMVKKGESVQITAKGRVCWDFVSLCAGPNGTKDAWGLYAVIVTQKTEKPYVMKKIGVPEELFKVGLVHNTIVQEDGEIIFIIPEGKKLEWEASDCYFYNDNTGRYKVEVTVTPAAPVPQKTIQHSGSG
jgi:hypothetical protein